MPTGDIMELIIRYRRGRDDPQLAADSGGVVQSQSIQQYRAGTARHASLPTPKIVHGLSVALNRRDDTEVLLAFGRSCGLNIDPPSATLVTGMPRGIETLDAYPALVADIHQMIASLVHTLAEQPMASSA